MCVIDWGWNGLKVKKFPNFLTADVNVFKLY
jgi:hypothetical protein